jgi:hypothetical protein
MINYNNGEIRFAIGSLTLTPEFPQSLIILLAWILTRAAAVPD